MPLPVLQKMWGITLCSTAHSCHAMLFSFHPEKLKHKAWLHDCLLRARTTTHGMGMGLGVAKSRRELKQWKRHRPRLLVLSHPMGTPWHWVTRAGAVRSMPCPARASLSDTCQSLMALATSPVIGRADATVPYTVKKPTVRGPMRQIFSDEVPVQSCILQ